MTRVKGRDPELWRRQFVLDPMRRIERAVHHELESVLAEAGYPDVRMPHIRVFAVLPRDAWTRMSAIAERLQLSPGAATQLVSHLERLGLVRRMRDPDDRRGVLVTPTPAAEAGYEESRRRLAELEGVWESTLGPRRWRTFREVLGQLAEHLEAGPVGD